MLSLGKKELQLAVPIAGRRWFRKKNNPLVVAGVGADELKSD